MPMSAENFATTLRAKFTEDLHLEYTCHALVYVLHWPASQQTVVDILAQEIGLSDNRSRAATLVEKLVKEGVLRWFNQETLYLELQTPDLLRDLGFRKNRGEARRRRASVRLSNTWSAAKMAKPRMVTAPHQSADDNDAIKVCRYIELAVQNAKTKWPIEGKQLARFVAEVIGWENYQLRVYALIQKLTAEALLINHGGTDWYWPGRNWPLDKPTKRKEG